MVTYGITIRDIISVKGGDVLHTTPDESLESAAHVLSDRRIGLLLVYDSESRVVGVLSERDVVRAVADRGAEAAARPVAEFMSPKVVVCQPHDDPKSVINTMKNKRIRHMPVVENGQLVGLVSIGDLLVHLLEHDELSHEADVLAKISI